MNDHRMNGPVGVIANTDVGFRVVGEDVEASLVPKDGPGVKVDALGLEAQRHPLSAGSESRCEQDCHDSDCEEVWERLAEHETPPVPVVSEPGLGQAPRATITKCGLIPLPPRSQTGSARHSAFDVTARLPGYQRTRTDMCRMSVDAQIQQMESRSLRRIDRTCLSQSDVSQISRNDGSRTFPSAPRSTPATFCQHSAFASAGTLRGQRILQSITTLIVGVLMLERSVVNLETCSSVRSSCVNSTSARHVWFR